MRTVPACAFALLMGLGLVAPAAYATAAGANGHIAYTKIVDPNGPSSRRAIFIDGAQVSFPSVTSTAADNDAFPAFSPDGKQIAFVRYETQTDDYVFYTANVDGSMPHRLMGLAEWDMMQGVETRSRAVNLVWAPDGKSVAFVRKYLPPSNLADTIGRVYVEDGSIGQLAGAVTLGQPFDGFDWLGGIDAGHSGTIVVPCNSILPMTLFCEFSDIVVMSQGTTAFPPEPPYDQMARPPHYIPMLQPVPGGGPPRVMFPMLVPVPVGGGNIYANAIFSIVPNDGSAPDGRGTDVQQYTNPSVLTCNTLHNGVSGAIHFPQYIYGDPVPSPDGKFFVTSRIEQSSKSRSDGNEISCDIEKTTYDLRVFQVQTGADARVVDTDVDTTYGIAWQAIQPNVRIVVTDGQRDPLHGASVELRDPVDNTIVRYSGPANPIDGEYLFQGVTAGRYLARVTLDDVQWHAFDVENDQDGVAAWEERAINVPTGGQSLDFQYAFNGTGIAASSVASAVYDRLDDMAAIFYQLHRFVEWVHSNLTTDTGAKVRTHAFASGISSTAYGSDNVIYLSPQDSQLSVRYLQDPVNDEWHEFTHHLEQTYTVLDCPNDTDHDGYINPDTCNSMVEGFATYLPAMAAASPLYAGITDLGLPTKAWEVRSCLSGLCSSEDLAVASLFWGLTDPGVFTEGTSVFGPGHALTPVTYADGIGMSLRDLWGILSSAKPRTVYNLRQALDADPRFGAITVDLDHDNVPDVTALDEVFLIHGFFGILNETYAPGSHPAYHYDAESGRDPAEPNAGVGSSAHFSFSLNGINFPARPVRFNIAPAPAANLSISAHDAAGHEVQGAQLTMTVHYPGYDRAVERGLPTASGNVVHLELPMYLDHLPAPDQVGLPPCDPENDYYVSVTLTATVNGYPSTNTHGFDNCSYFQAQLAATGSVAASYDLMFPEDSAPPITTIQTLASGNVVGQYTDGTWTVTLHCDDPVVSGFATGCLTTQYSLDGAPFVPYGDPVVISEPGLHTFYFTSLDGSGNAEATRSVSLGIGTQLDDETPPVTTASAVASVPPTGDHVTTGYWTVALSCADPAGPEGALVSGCQQSMYSIDSDEFLPYSAPVEIHDVGRHTFSYFSIDVSGNYESPTSIQLEVADVVLTSVPDVVGLTQSAAAAAIVNAGLSVGGVTQQSSNSIPAGSVISQSPVAGTSVAAGTAVNLFVSSGPATGSSFDALKAATQAVKTTPPALKTALLLDVATTQSLFDHARYPAALAAILLYEDLVRLSSGHGIAKADATNLLALSSAVKAQIRARLPGG